MNLSKYAGLFILIIIVGVVMLMLVANVINRSAGKVFIISLVGSFIGIWIVDILNFEDASLETVVTIMVSALLPSCLVVFNWGIQYVNEMHKKKLYVLKEAIDDEIVKPQSHLESQKAKIKDVLHEIQSLNISSDLQKECIAILIRAQEITDDSFIDNYYAMTVLPYIKRCKAYEEQIKEYGEEFDELVSKHRYYSECLGMPVISFTFSMDTLNSLRHEVAELESQSAKIEEQQYISESLDQVMRDMGYNVVGSREVVKKSGRKFRNELYHFSAGSVVNVTYAANGQISMELGGVDTCDREPSEEESSVLCDEMVEFCDEFPEIERRLKEKGVILMNRISMLPPAEEYAQIINVSDFNMTDKVDVLETASKKQTEKRKQVLRKE